MSTESFEKRGEIKSAQTLAKQQGLSAAETKQLVQLIQSAPMATDQNGYIRSAVTQQQGMTPALANVLASWQQNLDAGSAFGAANKLTQNEGNSVGGFTTYAKVADYLAQHPNDMAGAAQLAKSLGVEHYTETPKIVQDLATSQPGEGQKLKQVKNNAGLDPKLGNVVYAVNTVGDGRTLTTIYLHAPDGSYQELGNTYQSVNTKKGLGDIGGFVLAGLGALALPGVGGFLAGELGSEVAGQIAAGALVGGTTSAVQGGDFLKGALGGAVGSGVGYGVGEALKGADIAGLPLDKDVVKGVSRFAGTTASGLASGRGLGKSAESGLTGAASGFASDKLFPGTVNKDTGKVDYSTGETLGRALTSNLISRGASALFSPTSSGGGGGGGVETTYQASSRTPVSVGTQALSQALRVGDPGAPLFGTESGEGRRKNVWNTASLKLKDETGT